MRYLSIEPKRPRIAVFDFTGCEGCELQLLNGGVSAMDFLKAIEIVSFRPATSARGQDYDIAFVEGAVSRADEVERLRTIRDRARLVVALGSCAVFGGVNRLKNALDLADANREVYGDKQKESLPIRAVSEVVAVDLEIPGCPVNAAEVQAVVQHLAMDVPYDFPAYPVCVECRQRFTSCVFEQGQLCMGLIAKAGCDAPCRGGGQACWGCRGPAGDANISEFLAIARGRGHSDREIRERLAFFAGFERVACGSI
jgi:sulfhydrogenase subunit delta